jgi:hypothetical protein
MPNDFAGSFVLQIIGIPELEHRLSVCTEGWVTIDQTNTDNATPIATVFIAAAKETPVAVLVHHQKNRPVAAENMIADVASKVRFSEHVGS